MNSFQLDDLTGKHCTICGYVRQASDSKKLKTCCPICQRSYNEEHSGATGHQALYLSSIANKRNSHAAENRSTRAKPRMSFMQKALSTVSFCQLIQWMGASIGVMMIAIIVKMF